MPGPIDLGGGVSASVQTSPVPGITLTHPAPTQHTVAGTVCLHADELCYCFVPAKVLSANPLTVEGSVRCPHCGQAWNVRSGRAQYAGT